MYVCTHLHRIGLGTGIGLGLGIGNWIQVPIKYIKQARQRDDTRIVMIMIVFMIKREYSTPSCILHLVYYVYQY